MISAAYTHERPPQDLLAALVLAAEEHGCLQPKIRQTKTKHTEAPHFIQCAAILTSTFILIHRLSGLTAAITSVEQILPILDDAQS